MKGKYEEPIVLMVSRYQQKYRRKRLVLGYFPSNGARKVQKAIQKTVREIRGSGYVGVRFHAMILGRKGKDL